MMAMRGRFISGNSGLWMRACIDAINHGDDLSGLSFERTMMYGWSQEWRAPSRLCPHLDLGAAIDLGLLPPILDSSQVICQIWIGLGRDDW